MKRKQVSVILLSTFILTLVLPNLVSQGNGEVEVSTALIENSSDQLVDVLISTHTQDYQPIKNLISSSGGRINREFKYSNGLAVTISSKLITELEKTVNVKRIALDSLRQLEETPNLNDPLGRKQGEPFAVPMEEDDLIKLSKEQIQDLPDTYWNYESMGASGVWDTGNLGQGSLSVIIDTGVYADHVILGRYPDGPVIGGVDLSSDVGTSLEGWNSPYNHWHGTHVAGILAANGGRIVHETEAFYYYYTKWVDPNPPAYDPVNFPGYYVIPYLGMAPFSEIFAIKVFPATGAGVPESEIINAIEYAIDMHLSGVDVDVISMSLGGGTGFDGRDLEDQTVDYATSLGITVVTSNGNEGPTSITSGSPGTANSAISVGAVSHPANTRFFYDYYYGIGDFVFTGEDPQIIYFSSRGPTSDGRDKPTVSATGFWVFSSYIVPYDPGASYMAWAGGTSMACPAVSGAVALLNSWSESNGIGASPYDYKEAITDGAVMLPNFDKFDQGAGFLNAENALASLQADSSYGDEYPNLKRWYSHRSVKPKGINTGIYGSGEYSYYFDHLEPGLGVDFFFKATPWTKKVTIEFSNFETGDDPINYNALELYLQSAVRSTDDYFVDSLIFGDAVFTFEDYLTTFSGAIIPYAAQDLILQPGWMRIVVQTAWDSYDWCSGTMKVIVEEERPSWCNMDWPDKVKFGIMQTGDERDYFPVGFGPNGVELQLAWFRDWTRYPTSDLDMFVEWFDGEFWYTETAGALFHSPEGVLIANSTIQEVRVRIVGAQTYDRYEPWLLKVYYLD